jgi:predicted permease
MNGSHLTLAIILSLAEIFGLMAIGGVSRRLHYIEEAEIDRWSRLVLDFLYPAFVFNSITAGFTTGWHANLWILPGLGFAIAAGGAVIGLALRYGLLSRDRDTHRTFLYCCVVNNYGYLPVIIIQNLWGPSMLANLLFFTLGSTVANWTVGIGVLGAASPKKIVRNLMTPTLLATIAAILVSRLGLAGHIPRIVAHIIAKAGSASVPMMLVLAGASLFKWSSFRITWQIAYVTIVRLIILPGIMIAGLRMLPLSPEVYLIAVLVALMPLAVSTVLYTRIYGGNPEFAAGSSLFCTLAAIVTVPAALLFLFR